MAEEPDVKDVPSEITLDDFNADEKQDSPKADPSPVKAEKPEVAKDTNDAKASKETPKAEVPEVPTKGKEGEATEADDAEVDEAVKPEDKPQTKADERKSQLNQEIRDLVKEKNDYIQQRNALKAEVEKANAEVYQPATEDELVEQGLSATDAKVEALRQSIEIKDYNDKVADAQLTLRSEAGRVLNDFPMFNPESSEYEEALTKEVDELLEANLIYDPNTNQVIGSNISPYKLYKTFAGAQGISVAKGQLKGQQDTEQMLANADTGNAATVAQKKEDPLMALWTSDD